MESNQSTSDNPNFEEILVVEIDDEKGNEVLQSVSARAIPDLSKCRSAIYQLYEWRDIVRLWHCKVCGKTFQHHKTGGSSTLNLHAKRKHSSEFKQLSESGNLNANYPKLNFAKQTKQLPKSVTVEEVRRRLVEYTILSDQPFTTIENESFRLLLKYVSKENPNVQIPSRQTLKKYIQESYFEEKDKLKREIQQNDGKISLVIDCWTSSNQHSFQAIIGTWIDNDWNIQTSLLDVVVLEGHHSGENLADVVGKVISEFDLWNKVMSIVTDNASNMNTMFRALDAAFLEKGCDFSSNKFRVRCLAHIVNLACQAMLGTNKKGAIQCSFDEEIDDENEEETDDHQWTHIIVISKIRRLIKAIRSSPQRRLILKKECERIGIPARTLIRDVATRWNSTLDMLLRVRELKQAVGSATEKIPDLASKYIVTDGDWLVVDTLISLLRPFKETTLKISSSRPTLSDTTAVYHVLFTHLEKYMEGVAGTQNEAGPSRSKRLKTRESESFPEWLVHSANLGWQKLREYYPTSDGLIYVAATVLDPRWKMDFYKAMEWDSNWQKNAKKIMNNFWDRAYKNRPVSDSLEESASSSNSALSEVYATGDLLDAFISEKMKDFQRSDDELKQYLSEPVVNPDLIKLKGTHGWWKENAPRFPQLSRMAKDVLSVQGTGVSVERFFSSGPDLLSARRQRLSPESIRECLSLKYWLKRSVHASKANDELTECRVNKWFGPPPEGLEDELTIN